MAVLYLVGCWWPTKLKQNRKKGRNMLVLSRDRYRWTVMFCRALIVLSTYLGFFSHSTYELFTNQVTHCWWSQSFIFEFHRTTADQRKVWSKKKNCYRFFCRLHESQSPWHSLISSCVTHAATTTKFQCTLWLSRWKSVQLHNNNNNTRENNKKQFTGESKRFREGENWWTLQRNVAVSGFDWKLERERV